MKELLSLKASFKQLTGKDWTPAADIPAAQVSPNDIASIHQKIKDQGETVRNLKSAKAEKVPTILLLCPTW